MIIKANETIGNRRGGRRKGGDRANDGRLAAETAW